MNREDSEQERLLDSHEAHVRAWNQLDFDALARLYDPQCLIFDTYAPPVFRSWQDFKDGVEAELKEFEEFTIRTFEQDARIEGRIGWVTSRHVIDGRRAGQPYRSTGRWTEIYERQEDGWKLVHLHSSVDPSPGPEGGLPLHAGPEGG